MTLRLSQPGVSKHLRVLREAGLVEVRLEGRQRWYRLRAEPLAEVDDWLEPYRVHWSERLDALEQHRRESELTPTLTGTFETIDGKPTLRFERRLPRVGLP